jgi:hypothetical protein
MRKIFILALVGLFTGCAGGPLKGAPAWALKGAGAFPDAGGRVFYGVGIAPGSIADASLRREAADNRARADIQRVFSATVEGSMTTYSFNDSERVERVLRTFQSGKISWVQIVDRYSAPDGTVYSLAKLDMDRI